MSDINDDIYLELNNQADELFKTREQKDIFRAVSIKKAAKKLKELFPNDRIVSVEGGKINGINMKGTGIGPSTQNRIAEIIGSSSIKGIIFSKSTKSKSAASEAAAKSAVSKGRKTTSASKSPNCNEVRPVMLAESYKEGMDPTGWWMSEKFDGNRAVWHNGEFCSRSEGKTQEGIFSAPQWFKDSMPKGVTIDGELWLGRGKLEELAFIRKVVPDSDKWKEVKYLAFDLPTLNKPFEERQKKLKELVNTHCSKNSACPIEYVEQTKVKSRSHMDEYFNKIISTKGEGIMLRKAGSLYSKKRTSDLLKKKPLHDAECIVVGYTAGQGKYNGKLGAFKCLGKSPTLNKYVEFRVSGMDDSIRNSYKQTHPVGTIVTYNYKNTSKYGVPTPPSYIRKRDDLDEDSSLNLLSNAILSKIDTSDSATLESVLNLLSL